VTDPAHRRALLADADLTIEGRLLDSSNSALLATCHGDGEAIRVVYKPLRGERPLWDFPTGTLGRREVAMAALDAAFGWGLVPTTVWRDDAPHGPGSIQAWVDVDPERPPVDVVDVRAVMPGWHTVAEGEGARGDHVCLVHEESKALRRLAFLDAVANNADRKGGHVLRDRDGSVYGIDHGLTFHSEDKLRTVLWGWSGEPVDPTILEEARVVASDWPSLTRTWEELLTGAEIAAAHRRLRDLIDAEQYPAPAGAWPALPWPAM
jgi:uncharacterized repeat protein (TIGR03843 family)